MFNFKVFLLMALVTPVILALSSQDSKDDVVVEDSQAVQTEQTDLKINWGPVWDDQEGHHEFVIKTTQESEEDLNNCAAPNGLGLQNLFLQVSKILPKEQIKAIVKSYAEDPEIKALKAFVRSPQTKAKVTAIRNSQEYQILKDYACRILHIDLIRYNQLARTLVPSSLVRASQRKGIRGLINAVNAVLPRQELRQLYRNLLISDEELSKAVAHLKSEEFHQLLLNVRNNVPEYKELTKQLRTLGVPIDEMREMLANSLGWAPEMGILV